MAETFISLLHPGQMDHFKISCYSTAAISAVTGNPAQPTSMDAGVVVGLLALGEGMPSTLGLQALRLLSWLCITAGVSMLAGGRGVSGLHHAPSAACLLLD